jgi:hypothetical protein
VDEKSTAIATTDILSLRQSVAVCVEGTPTFIGCMSGTDLFYLFGHTEKVLMCSECSEFSELLRRFNDLSCHLKHVTMSNAR